MPRTRTARRGWAPSFLFVLLACGACGRPATEADCQLIIDRNVEVQMRAMKLGDPVLIAKKQEELRAAMKNELKDCVNRRVTDGMMRCVREAQTADEITKCIR
jgi:hypothetical protein